jgi:predicted lipoprotein with Yx(FWY)xxD motif
MKKPALLALAPVAAIVIAGCGGGGSSAPSYGAAPAASGSAAASGAARAAAAGTTVTLRPSKIGSFLADANGRTLYLFEADKTSASTCYSACASLWPPLTTAGAAKAGPGVLASRLGVTKRTGGAAEVTYHGHPLYYYAGDTKPGDTTGQAINQFGALWYVVARDGNKIDTNGH